MVSKTIQIIAACITLAVVLAYGASVVVEGPALPVAVLLAIGVVLPTAITQRQTSSEYLTADF